VGVGMEILSVFPRENSICTPHYGPEILHNMNMLLYGNQQQSLVHSIHILANDIGKCVM